MTVTSKGDFSMYTPAIKIANSLSRKMQRINAYEIIYDARLLLLLPRSKGSIFQGHLRSRSLLIHEQVVVSRNRKWYMIGHIYNRSQVKSNQINLFQKRTRK